MTPIATGLDQPRALAVGPGHTLYVAEAGHGGGECIPEAYPSGGAACAGFTGRISVIDGSGVHRVVTGLASQSKPGGFAATGVDGISVLGSGELFGLMALSPQILSSLPRKSARPISSYLSKKANAKANQQLGLLFQTNASGHWRAVANVGRFDFKWSAEHKNLDPQFPEANPYGVLAERDVFWVVDAATNTLDKVKADGSISVVAFIPNPPVLDSVPTCVDRGPDGALYVGELTGAGNGAGKSRVWRVVPGTPPSIWATGLTAVTGCGFGSDGHFYATEFSTLGYEHEVAHTGAFVRVPPHSTSPSVIASGLSFPQGFAQGPDGSFYVSNWSIAPARGAGGPTGEVVQITP